MKLQLIGVALIGMMAMTSCSVETELTEVAMDPQTFLFEDIYEGSNSATIEMDSDAMIQSQESLDSKEIESVFISGVTLTKNDSVGLSEITSSKLQIMSESEDLPMVTVAVKTEIAEGVNSIDLDVIDDVDLKEYMDNGKIYLVLDANFNIDNETEQPVEAVVKFAFNTAKK